MTYRGSSRTHKRFISYDQSTNAWSIVEDPLDTTSWVTEVTRALGCAVLGAVGWYLITVMAFV